MKKINKEQYKISVLYVLKVVKTPIWVSSLANIYNLPCAYLNEKKTRPTTQGLRELIEEGKIIPCVSAQCIPGSKKQRIKIALADFDEGDKDFHKKVKEKKIIYNFDSKKIKVMARFK
jgi:hypothetical protein